MSSTAPVVPFQSRLRYKRCGSMITLAPALSPTSCTTIVYLAAVRPSASTVAYLAVFFLSVVAGCLPRVHYVTSRIFFLVTSPQTSSLLTCFFHTLNFFKPVCIVLHPRNTLDSAPKLIIVLFLASNDLTPLIQLLRNTRNGWCSWMLQLWWLRTSSCKLS